MPPACTAAFIRDNGAAGELLGKAGRAITTRNWATVLKLQSSLEQAAVPGDRSER